MSNLNLFEMKKLNFFFFLSLFALTGYFVPGIAQENTAINIPGKSGSNYFQFRFSDSALGTHSVGNATVDSRTKTFTMSAWIKASTTKGDIMGHLQDNRYQNSGSFSVRLMDGKLGLYARGYYPNGGDKFATAVNSSSSTSLEIGVWTFISVVSDDTNKTLTLYKDGVQIQQETVDAEGGLGLLPDACIMFVGGESNTDEVFAGDLDEVQLWNRALTSEEIKASMIGIDPVSAEGLLAYYTFVDNVNNEYQNQGSVENLPAKLVSGPKRSGSQSWEGQYYDTFSTVASTLVEGHIIPAQQFTYTYTTVDGGSVTAKIGDNTIGTGEKFETGSDIVLTVSANADYELSSLLVNDVEKKNEVFDGTLTIADVTSDLVVKALFVKKAASYCTPVGTTNPDVYLAAITSSGAKDGIEINYTANSDLPSGQPYVKLDQVLTVQRGSTFTINYVGANSEEEKPQITYCHAEIFVDWNGDGVFEGEDEVLPMIGADAGMETGIPTESGRNLDVKNISQSFTVPEDAVIGQACVRIRYVDAWHIRGNEGADTEHGACAGINKGCAYDIILNITEGEAPEGNLYTYNTVAGGSVTAAIGNVPLLPNTRFDDGSVIVLTVVPEENYELTSLLINNEEKVSEVLDNTLTLPALSENLTVVAAFGKKTTTITGSAIRIPRRVGSLNHYMFRFDDKLLGDHTNGSSSGDNRIRTFTMSAWVNPATTSGDILGLVQSKYYVETGSFGLRLRNGKLELFSRCVTLPNIFGDDVNVKTGVDLPTGKWAFLTVVIDNDNKFIALYKDGQEVVKQNFNRDGFGMLPDESCFFVGNYDFAGDIEDVQLWKGALTQDQIKASRAGYTQVPDNLLYYYKFNKEETGLKQFPNQGTGGDCVAELAFGTIESVYIPGEGNVTVYNYEAITPEYVAGHFKEKFKVTYSGTVEGGTFVVKNDGIVVESGSDVDEGTWLTVDVTPEDGYLLKSIKVNGVVIEKGQGFVLADNSEVVVEFSDKLLYSYIGTVGGNVAATINDEPLTDQEEFDRGSEVKLTIIPDDHYELISLMIGSEERKDDVKDNILVLSDLNENLTVSATFSLKRFAVTFQSIGDGTLTIEHDDVSISSGEMFEYGTVLTGILSYEDPIVISSLTKNGISILDDVIGNKFNFTVDDVTEIKAVFKGAAYTVDYPTDLVGGKLVVTNDADGMEIAPNTELPKDTEITIKPVAEKYYEVTEFRINGRDCLSELQDNGGEYWITLAENVTVSIVFAYPDGVENTSLPDVYYNHKTSVLYVSPEAIVNVYNITGSLVFKGVGTQNLGKLPIGNYIAKVKTDNGIRTIKFIKK